MTSTKLTPLAPDQRIEVATWLAQHGDSVPHPVRVALEQHAALCDGLAGTRHKLTQALSELRRALGITASSERRNNSGNPLGAGSDPQPPKSRRGRLEFAAERYELLMLWHKALVTKHRQKLKATRSKLMRIQADPALDDQDPSEAEQAAEEAEVLAHMHRLQLGGPAQPALEPSSEAFMTGAQVATVEDTLSLPAPADDTLPGKVIDTVVDERERFDFSFTLRRITVQVEKKVIVDADGERRIVSASTASLGPPRYSVTWDFLAHMTILVAQYALPMNRLGTLLSTDDKRFTAGSLSRMLRYVAERFVPVYLTLFDQLADSRNLSGDDTSCRVTEVSRFFARRDREPDQPQGNPSWHDYRNVEAADKLYKQGDRSLAVVLAREFGFEHARRNGNGAKKALHATTISGRSDSDDPRSLIVFYRSHLGGFGNLLEALLQRRDPTHSKLTVQSDLATVNLVTDKELLRRFLIRIVGCASHARRPFALYEHEDPDSCGLMLEMFKGLFIHEKGLSLVGRNYENVIAVRTVDGRELWLQIKDLAATMSERWSRETKLGEGARYITRNFDKLTAYLDDPRLDITNNFSERMLRMEKLIEGSALFRTSIEGRCALDILRTVLQTAVAARAPLQPYLLSVLHASPEDVQNEPERFTPRAWASANGSAASLEQDMTAATGAATATSMPNFSQLP